MKKLRVLVSICLFFILVGCNENSGQTWYETKEEAIKFGLQQEGTDNSAILGIEEFEGETFVFYVEGGALGVASLTEDKRGFSWYRSQPYVGFDANDSPYSTAGFDYKTVSGLEVSILVGKVYDNSIQTMKLIGDGAERELQVHKDSKLFFAIHKVPFNSINVEPMESKGEVD